MKQIIHFRLKAKVVYLYQSLCTLIGESPVKRREIRLRVAEGLPSGPTKTLEKFFNDNIGADGNPPFPDFNDVMSCVKKSNLKDNLGWSNEKIVAEGKLTLYTSYYRHYIIFRPGRATFKSF